MRSCRAADKTRILSVLQGRARRGEAGLSSQEIRQITHYDRSQVKRLMNELRDGNLEIAEPGRGRAALYEWTGRK